jgi:hypothetical protein
MSVTVHYHYNESVRKWDVFVTGTTNETEAKQAYHAATLTAQLSNPEDLILDKTIAKHIGSNIYRITPYGLAILNIKSEKSE